MNIETIEILYIYLTGLFISWLMIEIDETPEIDF